MCVIVKSHKFLSCAQDIATRVIAEGLRPEQTMVSKVMTRSPIFVTSDSLALEALQKMVQGLCHLLLMPVLLLNFWHFETWLFGLIPQENG